MNSNREFCVFNDHLIDEMIFSSKIRRANMGFTAVSTSIIWKAHILIKWKGTLCIYKIASQLTLEDIQNLEIGSAVEGEIPPGKWTLSFIPVWMTRIRSDWGKRETVKSEFVVLRLQANPTSEERDFIGIYWSRIVSVVQTKFYHYHEDEWVQMDEPWIYAVQILLTDAANLEQEEIPFNQESMDI